MTEKEKIIEGFEMAYKYSNVDEDNTLVPQQLVLDTLALLKAQDPLKPVPSDRYVRTELVTFDYKCVVCNAGLVRHWVCCPCCGQAVKWE